MTTFHFVRVQDDGRISSITPLRIFESRAEAKAAAPDLFAGRRGGGRIALAELVEEAIHTSRVRYVPFAGKP